MRILWVDPVIDKPPKVAAARAVMKKVLDLGMENIAEQFKINYEL